MLKSLIMFTCDVETGIHGSWIFPMTLLSIIPKLIIIYRWYSHMFDTLNPIIRANPYPVHQIPYKCCRWWLNHLYSPMIFIDIPPPVALVLWRPPLGPPATQLGGSQHQPQLAFRHIPGPRIRDAWFLLGFQEIGKSYGIYEIYHMGYMNHMGNHMVFIGIPRDRVSYMEYMKKHTYIYKWLLVKIPLSQNGHSSRIKILLSRNFRELHVYLSWGPCWPTTPLMKIRSPPAKLRQRITDHFFVAF